MKNAFPESPHTCLFGVPMDDLHWAQYLGDSYLQTIREQGCPLPRPVRELKGFAKVQLNAGETKHVEIPLGPEAFAYWSPDKKGWVTDTDHTFTVEVGESERDIKLKQAVTLK